jgi:hypothetical protein
VKKLHDKCTITTRQSIHRRSKPIKEGEMTCQFNQHFLRSFCADILALKSTHINSKYKEAARKTFVRKSREQNVGEIDT